MKKLILIGLCLISFVCYSQTEPQLYPSHIYMMDEKFAHHVIVVEKSTHQLFVYENVNGAPRLVKSFLAATGKFKGDKLKSGDHKTPEGIYTLYDFYSQELLLNRHGKYAEIYGSGAFPMDYPNFIDKRNGKTGGGIWLHSTDDDNRVNKGLDSRGCVVVQNADLKEISRYIELKHTPIIVVQDVHFLNKHTWEKNKLEISNFIKKWATAWQEKDFDTYMSSYSETEFYDNIRGRFPAYKQYKKAVFSRPDKPRIQFDHISILNTNDYAMVTLQQTYNSTVINDIGKKVLYLKKDDSYNWKIVGELFNPIPTDHLAFTPSMRFFQE
ncbi:MAG TPA: L,D-transpeptidase family protein [Bacteriovoracaceae bacterium]|nr:L,D-transpeptidase family protein [Bacteriovoracaceae bacterium]